MSHVFIPTRKGNPCELCDDTTGNCRQTQTLLLCMTFAEANPAVSGYKFIGRTKDDLWGKWIPEDDQEWMQSSHQIGRSPQPLVQKRQAPKEPPKRAIALPAEERDRLYQCLLNSLSLHPEDREDLRQRGLTDEQIKAWGVTSVQPWQALASPLPPTLPGVSVTGKQLSVSSAGYLCPIRNVEGQIVGFQLRLRTGQSGGRYRWLTSRTKQRPQGSTPHLPNGELPLAVHRPHQTTRSAIALVEGVGAKPFILSQRLGIVTVGAAGGQFASSPETLRHTLSVLSRELNTRIIEFYPDGGTAFNRSVRRQYQRVWKLLQQWGYEIQVAWWGQEIKGTPDIDELDNLSQIGWITTAQFEAIAHPRFDWLAQIKAQLRRKPRSKAAAVAFQPQLEEGAIAHYEAGDRLAIWRQAMGQGYRYILDTSPPGTGKSFDAGRLDPAQLGQEWRQVLYLSDQHRNPTVETLSAANGWIDLEARHAGLIREATPGGRDRLKRVSSSQLPSIPGNCNRNRLIGALRSKQIQGADTAAIVCGTCPLREACLNAEGPGYGFLHQRYAALPSPKLRAHPDSLPPPSEYDYEHTVLIWDEPGQSFRVKRDMVITLSDLEQTLRALVADPDLLQAVQPLIARLLPYLQGQVRLPRFGLTHREVVSLLPDVSSVDVAALEGVLQPDLSFLNATAQYGVDLADLPASLRKSFSEQDGELAVRAQQQLIKRWLPDFLRVLTGEIGGTLRLDAKGITLSVLDSRHRAIAGAAGAIVFLDATLTREDLALKLGCDPQEIYGCRQAIPDLNNLKILQVVDLGRLGLQRGNLQKRRVAAIVDHYQRLDPQAKVIDFKQFAKPGMGAWWRDSRGVNDFAGVKTLILVGTPCRNLADLLAEYAVLTGCQNLEDPGFRGFVDRLIRADMHQAIGRLRAHRRGEEALQIVVLSDFNLQWAGVQQVKASEIAPEAADKFELFVLAVQEAVNQLEAAGEKITQTAIARVSGYSQQYISRYWKLLQTLFESSYSNSGQKAEAPLDEVRAIAEEAIAACQDTPQLLATVGEVFFDWLSPPQGQRLWQRLSRPAQIKVLTALLLTLPSEQLLELCEG